MTDAVLVGGGFYNLAFYSLCFQRQAVIRSFC